MGFFSNLGSKISHAAHDLGAKASHVVRKGVKIVADHAGTVRDVADKVGGVAGVLATGAAMAGIAPVAAGLGAVAAGAKGVSKLADVAGTAAKGIQGATAAVTHGRDAIDSIRAGNIGTGIAQGKAAVAGAQLASTSGKRIQRMTK